MDSNSATFKRTDRQTMPRKMAQPSQSENQKECLDRAGGPNHLQSPSSPRQPMGADSQITSRKVQFFIKTILCE